WSVSPAPGPDGVACTVTAVTAGPLKLSLDCFVGGALRAFEIWIYIDPDVASDALAPLIGAPLVLSTATEAGAINPQTSFALRGPGARLRLAGFSGYRPDLAEGLLLAPIAVSIVDGVCERPEEVDFGVFWRGAIAATLTGAAAQI